MKQRKVLWISRLAFPCSYHYVTKALWEGLKKTPNIFNSYDFSFLTLTLVPTTEQFNNFVKEFGITSDKFFYNRLDSTEIRTQEDEHFVSLCLSGYMTLVDIIKKVSPELIIILEDTEPAKKLTQKLNEAIENKELVKTFKTLTYIPIDCHNVKNIVKDIKSDYYASPTRYGANQLKELFDNVFVLPHSVINDECEKDIEKENNEFTIISLNTNHKRKRWDLVFESYLRFAQIYKKPCRLIVKALVLKGVTNKASLIPNDVFDLEELYNQLSSKFPASNANIEFHEGTLSRKEINSLYKRSDVGLYMTSGEGFGLTPLEGSTFGIPQIVPDNTSFRELFPYYPYRVKTEETTLYHSRQNITDESANYLCLFKSYMYDKIEFKEIINIPISQILSFVISPVQNNLILNGLAIPVVKWFLTLNECEQYMKENNLPPRFQILINLNKDFLSRQNWSNYPNSLRSEKKLEYYANFENIDARTTFNRGSCGIPKVEDAVQKLMILATNEQVRSKAGDLCKHYISKFTEEEVNKKFVNILRTITPVMPPIIIFSYERSGTHFLINSIVENLGYDSQWVDIDDTFPKQFEYNKVYKCHHCYNNVSNINFTGCAIINLKREMNDNLKSYQKYLYLVPWKEGPKIKPNDNLEEFLNMKTSDLQERYQKDKGITQEERYIEYHKSWEMLIVLGAYQIKLNYEDMVENFNDVMAVLMPLKGYIKPTKVDKTIL